MKDDAHRQALVATAKIALGLTVLGSAGCGGRIEIHGAHDDDGADGGAPPANPVTSTTTTTTTTGQTTTGQGGAMVGPGAGGFGGFGGAGGAPEAFCDAASPATPVDLDPAAFGCCVDHLSSQPLATWESPTEELMACCHEVVNQIDQDPALASQIDASLVAPVWPQDDTISCCEVLGNPCTMPCGCTVWGPPMPFRLAGPLRLLDEVA